MQATGVGNKRQMSTWGRRKKVMNETEGYRERVRYEDRQKEKDIQRERQTTDRARK